MGKNEKKRERSELEAALVSALASDLSLNAMFLLEAFSEGAFNP